MEYLVGYGSDDDRFAAFLSDWRTVLDQRVEQVRAALTTVDGLSAAVLAGSLGRGEPWPLSDIDLILSWTTAATRMFGRRSSGLATR